MILFPLALVFYETIVYLAVDMYVPAMSSMRQDLQVSEYLVQLTITLWFLGSAALQLILGPISDYIGRRPVILCFCGLFIVSSVVCAITDNIYLMILARFCQGTAVCSVGVAGYAAIHELLEHKAAIKVLAWMGSITVMAPTLGPLLGSFVLEFGSWRDIFWILAGCSVLALLFLWRVMPESNQQIKYNKLNISKALQNYNIIIRNTNFVRYTIVAGCVFSGMIAWITAGPILIIEDLHYSPFAVGVVQVFVFGSFAIGTIIVRVLINKYSAQFTVRVGVTLVLLGGSFALILALYKPELLMGLLIALMCYAMGAALIFAPLNRLAMEAVPNINMGTKIAIFSCIFSIFGVISSILVDSSIISIATILFGVALVARVLYIRGATNV
ncbi:MAG: hypothetical protein COC15_01040 [Legionellales bacterium]|nr:MAG: hypothetical protein COC15_01040 [Legionellales bacterium]